MNIMLLDIGLVIAGYLLGSLSSAIITCQLMGLPDPRELGSGNPGATNVLRTGSKTAAIITLLGDLLKGLIPVGIAQALDLNLITVGAVGLAAFVGHLYPVFFKFKGGKGVATALGVMLGFHWLIGVLWGATWLLMAALFRYSSLSALVATVLAPGFVFWVTGSVELVIFMCVIAVLIFWRHRSNIWNLINGDENRIGSK